MPKFKKGSKEAKAFMAKLRAKKNKKAAPKKSIGATKKVAAKKVVKKTAPKKVVRKSATTKRHTDTKSHNVNITIGGLKKDIQNNEKKLLEYKMLLADKLGDIAAYKSLINIYYKRHVAADMAKRKRYQDKLKSAKSDIAIIRKMIRKYTTLTN